MANHTYSKGLLYKKTLNSSGEVTGSVPLLLKTLGSLVIMSDGTDAETAISTAISNMVTPDETTIVTGQDGITISVKKSTSAEIDEILGDVPTSHTWEGYYTKSETEALIDVVDDKISQSGIETALGYTPIPTTAKGSNNGVAELDATGKVPASQLPSYVDDVIESATYAALPETGESGKIYVTLNDDKTYRWSGSAYVEISASLALGETSSTAYRGDRGKTAYDHSQAAHARTDATNAAIVSGKLNINGTATNIGDFKAVSTAASQGLTDTEKANALANIGAVPNSDFVVAEQNILYNLNMGVKNILIFNPNPAFSGDTATINGVTCKYNGDGTYTLNGTATANATFTIYLIEADENKGNLFADCRLTGGSTDAEIAVELYDTPWTRYSTSTDTGVSSPINTIPANVRVCVFIRAFLGKSFSNHIMRPMICTEKSWAQSHDFMPPALPNYDLTQLEAEDKAALAEVVDSGAKNVYQVPVTIDNDAGLTITTNPSTGTITVSGTATKDRYIQISSNLSLYGTYIVQGCPSTGSSSTYYLHLEQSNEVGANDVGDKKYAGSTNTYNSASCKLYIRIFNGVAFGSGVTFTPIVCTKAAFGVSSKFVPYTKSNSQLTTELGSVETVLEAIL